MQTVMYFSPLLKNRAGLPFEKHLAFWVSYRVVMPEVTGWSLWELLDSCLPNKETSLGALHLGTRILWTPSSTWAHWLGLRVFVYVLHTYVSLGGSVGKPLCLTLVCICLHMYLFCHCYRKAHHLVLSFVSAVTGDGNLLTWSC